MTHLDGVLKLNNNILIKRGCLKSVVPCHIEPVEIFQLTIINIGFDKLNLTNKIHYAF